MKKVLLFLSLIGFAFVGLAQNTALDVSSLKSSFDNYLDVNKQIGADKTYLYKYGVTADTISSNDTLWNYDIAVLNLKRKLDSELRIKLDSVSGSPTVTVSLQGKWSYNDSYTTISSATWHGTSSDTTIAISNTTNKFYRFYNILLDATATAQKASVNYLEFGVTED